MEKHKVTVKNVLVRASYTLSVVEKRLILCFISRIPPHREIEPTTLQKLDIRQYAKLFGKQDKHALAEVKKVLDSLHKRRVRLLENSSHFNWVSCKPTLIDDDYTLCIQWTEEVINYISQIKQYFTSYPLGDICKLSSFNAIRIYEYILCELGEKQGDIPYITLEDFRFMLDIGEKQHTTVSNLNNNVLKPAILAINRDTSMVVEAKLYKKGRKTIGFRFLVGSKEEC